MSPNDQSDDGTIAACHAETVADTFHRYPLRLCTAMVRSGLPMPEFFSTFLFHPFHRILPMVPPRLSMLHPHPQVPVEYGGTHDS